jgi:integrase/recombinase XerC
MPARTVATYRAAVFHWLDFQKIPFDRSSAIRVSRGRSKQRTYRHALSPGELILYDQAIDKSDIPDPYWTILRLLPWSGLRIAEACTLKGDAITTHGAISGLLVVGKGNKSRFVPLPKHGRELLKAWIKIRDRSSDWLFPRGRGRKGLDRPALPDTARLYLRELRGATKGLPANLTPHVLRHCYATTILNRGGNLRELQDLMGHASISTTAIYTAPSVERLASVVDLLEDE